MKTSFDRIAPFYDMLAYWAFQGKIQQAQRHFLPIIPENAHLLFVGGGTGFLLPDLFRLEKIRHVTYVEASAHMLSRAKETVAHYQKKHSAAALPTLTFIHGSEKDIPDTAQYQVVITNFIFDMYTDEALPLLMHRIHSHLSQKAIWLFTDFRLSPQKKYRFWQRSLLKFMFWFFRITAGLSTQQLPDYARHFQTLGWKNTQEQSFFGDFIVSRAYRATAVSGKDAFLSER
ncbi:MAG: class I SAM-dependent methyltransferase [Cyclobacteriaceae bacterium]